MGVVKKCEFSLVVLTSASTGRAAVIANAGQFKTLPVYKHAVRRGEIKE
jgi:hypothetical protein